MVDMTPLRPLALTQAVKSSKMKDEVQPLLPGNPEPVNDTYERGTPRPDLRTSPENVILHLPGPMGPQEPEVNGSKVDEGDDSNNPLLNRNIQHSTSNFATLIHLLKGNVGTGILAMPDAFRNAGLVVGTVGTLLMGIICTHCMHVLVKCSHELCIRTEVPSLDFAAVSETSFRTGPLFLRKYSVKVKFVVNCFLCITQLGFCSVYFLFVATNLQEVIELHFYKMDKTLFLTILILPMILLSLVKNLKNLTPVSAIASFLTVVGLGITFHYLIQDLPSTSTVDSYAPWSRLPLYFGTVVYAFEGIGMVLPLENKMKTPQDFGGWNGVLNTGMVIVAALYTLLGFFGYLKYGENVKLGSITLNLPQCESLAEAVRGMMAVAIFLSYGLQFYVPVSVIWPCLEAKLQNELARKFGEYILRVFLVIITFGIAAIVPELGTVISLVGAVCSSTLALIFPPCLEIVTFWDKGLGKYKWILWKDIFIMIFGILGFGFGTYASIMKMAYSEK